MRGKKKISAPDFITFFFIVEYKKNVCGPDQAGSSGKKTMM
jgi:hypothetical protein